METIRVVKQKRGSATILWFLLTLVILAAAVTWLAADRNEQFKNAFFSEEDTLEKNDYSRQDRSIAENQQVNVPAYISFINRQVIPADSVNKEIKEKASYHLRLAIAEIDSSPENARIGYSVDVNDSLAKKDSTVAINNDTVNNSVGKKTVENNSLYEAGTKLINLQKNEYPALSKIGEKIQESIISLEKNENEEELRKFFVLSSSLLQEINLEENKNQYAERGNYENFK